jgi:hypothetical protein
MWLLGKIANSRRLMLLLVPVFSFVLVVLLANQVLAQEPIGPWAEPVNLSLSAGTSDPVLVVDSTGRGHAIWKDSALDRFVYTSRENGTWRVAQAVELPFGTRQFYPDLNENAATPLHTPVLWSSQDDRIHALWVSQQGRLFYSNVSANEFASFVAWSAPQELAPSALGAAAITGDAGRLHVVYARPAADDQSPSGLYYRGSSDGGGSWSGSLLIYESPYFRSLDKSQLNLQLASTLSGAVFAAWDNPYLERVYLARSGDAGQSWDPAVEIDRRIQDDGAEAAGPNAIRVVTTGEVVHLEWQAGHEGVLCSPYHQLSIDGGLTWQPPERLVFPEEACSDASFLVAGQGKVVLLIAMTENGGYLAGWNGLQWGEALRREELVRFINPLNYREVSLACHQVATGAANAEGHGNTAIVLGCDTGKGGDIWASSVAMDALVEEIAPQATPVWQRPEVVSQPTDSDWLQLLADADGWLHAMWVQRVSGDSSVEAIHYSRWDGIGWSQPKDVLLSPDGKDTAQPSVSLSPDDKIMAVWTNGIPGSVYFSQADLARASNGSEWSSPIVLPMPVPAASAPEIDVGQDGKIYVVYVVPLNEGRGVYLTRSDDGGESWSDPQQVFDGVAAGWAMVDKPQIAVDNAGVVHLMWLRASSPPGSEPQSLYYSRSVDGGASWSEFSQVTQSPSGWSDLLSSGELAVHRFWLADYNDLWHQASNDGGANWGQPQRVSSSGEALPLAASVFDGAGRPWLLQAAASRTETGELRPPIELRSWVISNGRWMSAEGLKFGGNEIKEFAAAATGGGDMDVVFSAYASGIGAQPERQTIYHSSRRLELPQVQPTALPTLTPTPAATATMTPTPAPMPTATTSFPTDQSEQGGLPIPIDTSNPLTGPLLGAIPAAIVVLIAFFVGVRLLRGDRRR